MQLDMRLGNADRNAGNILCSRDLEGNWTLTPIDHGYRWAPDPCPLLRVCIAASAPINSLLALIFVSVLHALLLHCHKHHAIANVLLCTAACRILLWTSILTGASGPRCVLLLLLQPSQVSWLNAFDNTAMMPSAPSLIFMRLLQAYVPFDGPALSYIMELDAEKDLATLAAHGLPLRSECKRVFRACTLLLKMGAARGMTPSAIASIMCR